MGCDTKTAATVWALSYKRATLMQASLAILSFLAGVGAWVTGGGVLWLVAALLSHLVAPRRPLTGIIRAAGHANGELTRGVSP
jgi:hypothetical protein